MMYDDDGTGVCCSPALSSPTGRQKYLQHMPCARLHSSFPETILENLERQQAAALRRGCLPARLIVVDGFSHEDFLHSAVMRRAALYFRNLNIFVIVTVPDLPATPPSWAPEFVDQFFLCCSRTCNGDDVTGRERCWRLFFSQVPSMSELDQVIDELAHQALQTNDRTGQGTRWLVSGRDVDRSGSHWKSTLRRHAVAMQQVPARL